MPVRAMHMMDVKTKLSMFGNTCRGNLNSSVGGVVEELNLEQLARIPDVACRLHKPGSVKITRGITLSSTFTGNRKSAFRMTSPAW